MQQLLYITFGWLLGLLSPAIVRRIERVYRANELQAAIVAELGELGHKMAMVAYKFRHASGDLPDDWLAWFESQVRAYAGEQPTNEMLEELTRIRNVPQQNRFQYLHPAGRVNKAISVMEYSVPLLTAHTGEIAIFPIPFQVAVLRIADQLSLFNQRVAYVQKDYERTFTESLSSESRKATLLNLENGYRQLADLAKSIADSISAIPQRRRKFLDF